ncbi:hypothetical protein DQQ01_12455 [Blautia argi]|uniref:Uncharacterized protein n=1 Tax=Blautia argi TaxID=1912897 RepID=A0A2Z4UCV9_9FIRM|nr:hypothetical protein DQQ01_12455 [Blautia argi]
MWQQADIHYTTHAKKKKPALPTTSFFFMGFQTLYMQYSVRRFYTAYILHIHAVNSYSYLKR